MNTEAHFESKGVMYDQDESSAAIGRHHVIEWSKIIELHGRPRTFLQHLRIEIEVCGLNKTERKSVLFCFQEPRLGGLHHRYGVAA